MRLALHMLPNNTKLVHLECTAYPSCPEFHVMQRAEPSTHACCLAWCRQLGVRQPELHSTVTCVPRMSEYKHAFTRVADHFYGCL